MANDPSVHKRRAATVALTCLAVVVVSLRFFSRYLTVRFKFAVDDWLIVVALVLTVCSMVMNLMMIEMGLGKNVWNVAVDKRHQFYKILLPYEYIYVIDLTIIKLSILFMYRRVFPVRSLQIASIILGTISILWTGVYLIVYSLQCMPIQKLSSHHMQGKCINFMGLYIGNALPNILTDVAILALPFFQISKLRIGTCQRCVLIGMFSLGGFVILTSIYRFYLLTRIDEHNKLRTLEPALVWSHIEMSAAVISACLPVLRPLVLYLSPKSSLCRFLTPAPSRSRGTALPEQLNLATVNKPLPLSSNPAVPEAIIWKSMMSRTAVSEPERYSPECDKKGAVDSIRSCKDSHNDEGVEASVTIEKSTVSEQKQHEIPKPSDEGTSGQHKEVQTHSVI